MAEKQVLDVQVDLSKYDTAEEVDAKIDTEVASGSSETLNSAKKYTDQQDAVYLQQAKDYADLKASQLEFIKFVDKLPATGDSKYIYAVLQDERTLDDQPIFLLFLWDGTEWANVGVESGAVDPSILQPYITACQAAQNAAEAAQDAAETAEDNANTAKDQALSAQVSAESAKTAAETAKTQAETFASNASASASTAQTQAGNAQTFAQNALSSATDAETYSDLSKQWAIKTDGTVDDTEYSSKYYAQQSAQSSSQAQSGATLAQERATSAASSASQASSYAQEAKDWANKTESTVDGTEYSAKHYANLASGYSATAQTSASSASISAQNAASSATEAEDALSELADQVELAQTAATNAQNYASAAQTSASNAASSETNASNSASAASQSATNASNSALTAAQDAQDAEDAANAADLSAISAAQSAQAAASSASLADIQNKITNCITKIPQDIKFELSSAGVLILKAGSKAWYPNGKDSDGTLLFGSAVTANDISWTISGNTNYENLFVFLGGNRRAPAFRPVDNTHSGSSDPGTTSTTYYNTSENYIDAHNSAGLDRGLTFPLAIVKVEAGKVTQIKQVFNGFGYIGQVLYALPGVEGLSPNGRNEDGSLKNELMTLDHVVTRDYTWNCAEGQYAFLGISQEYGDDFSLISTYSPGMYKQQSTPPDLENYITWHRLDENKLYRTEDLSVTPNWVLLRGFAVGPVFNTGEGTNVSSWNIARPVAAVDMSNTSYIAKMAMPSNRYVELTLGANGATYTAPANGYIQLSQQGNSSNNAVSLLSLSTMIQQTSKSTTGTNDVFLPVKSGDKFRIFYVGKSSSINRFRFIYAEGEK